MCIYMSDIICIPRIRPLNEIKGNDTTPQMKQIKLSFVNTKRVILLGQIFEITGILTIHKMCVNRELWGRLSKRMLMNFICFYFNVQCTCTDSKVHHFVLLVRERNLRDRDQLTSKTKIKLKAVLSTIPSMISLNRLNNEGIQYVV